VADLVLVRRMKRHLLCICLAAFLALPAIAARYSDAEWKARFPHRPFPDYPARYRLRHLTGSGWYRMHVDEQGHVTAVTILKSTGHRELDTLVIKALIRWRGLPGPKWELDMPITFTMDMRVNPRNPADARTYR
jgi:TonB family protein